MNVPTRIQYRQFPPNRPLLVDRIENAILSVEQQKEFVNELGALHSLAVGLDSLAGTYRAQREICPKPPAGTQIRCEPLLACLSQWYAVSAVNLAWLTGLVLHRTGLIQESIPSYRNRVAAPVLPFRNKVGAHFARAVQDRRDDAADQLLSVVAGQVRVSANAVYCPPGVIGVKDSGRESVSRVKPWCLEEVHAWFYHRYWSQSDDYKDGVLTQTRIIPFKAKQFPVSFTAPKSGDGQWLELSLQEPRIEPPRLGSGWPW